jgi:threonine/homoserine/homoserine lactone efflux protein
LNYEILMAFSIATALLSLAPGPDNIFVLTQSVARGMKFGLVTTAGLMTGCLVHTSLVAFGLSAVIRDNSYLFMTIKIFGALYLFYLAFMTMNRSADIALSSHGNGNKGLGELYRQGFIMNVLNPKVAVFFLAFFPAFLFSKSLSLFVQFYILGGIFILVSFGVFALISVLAGVISGYLRTGSGIGAGLKWLQVSVFTGIGIYLLFSAK